MAASRRAPGWRHLAWAAVFAACAGAGPAAAQSCDADEVEVGRTSDYLLCEKRKVFECMKGAKQRWSDHQRECARQTVAAARSDGYTATAGALSCAGNCLLTLESRKTAAASACITSCGVAATYATKIIDNYVDSPCLNDLLKVQKQETQACKALGNR